MYRNPYHLFRPLSVQHFACSSWSARPLVLRVPWSPRPPPTQFWWVHWAGGSGEQCGMPAAALLAQHSHAAAMSGSTAQGSSRPPQHGAPSRALDPCSLGLAKPHHRPTVANLIHALPNLLPHRSLPSCCSSCSRSLASWSATCPSTSAGSQRSATSRMPTRQVRRTERGAGALRRGCHRSGGGVCAFGAGAAAGAACTCALAAGIYADLHLPTPCSFTPPIAC
jgi:hypothetical protein